MKINKHLEISTNFSYQEIIKSETAKKHNINNEITSPEVLLNISNVVNCIAQVCRSEKGLNVPIIVSSGYRCKELNSLISKSKNSQHTKGEALDLKSLSKKVCNADIFHYIKDNLVFDQLIWEKGDEKNPSWVHVSLKRIGVNRGEVLRFDGSSYSLY